MKKNFTPFERSLKDKMEQFEFPYEQGPWAGLQDRMGMAKSGGSVWIVSLISTVIVLSGGAIALGPVGRRLPGSRPGPASE